MKYPWIVRDGTTGHAIATVDGMDAATARMRELGAEGFAESCDGGQWCYVPTSPRTDPYAPGYGRRLHPGMTTSQHRALCRADAWNERRLRLEFPAMRATRKPAAYAAR